MHVKDVGITGTDLLVIELELQPAYGEWGCLYLQGYFALYLVCLTDAKISIYFAEDVDTRKQ
jgi:hypothetical protein